MIPRRFFINKAINGFGEVRRLNKIRNQIQHRGTRIGRKQKSMFLEVFSLLQRLYKKEFPKRRKFIKFLDESKDRI